MRQNEFVDRMKKVAHISNKGEISNISIKVLIYLVNEIDTLQEPSIIQSAECIGANIGGYSYSMVRKAIVELCKKNIVLEERCEEDLRSYEYKLNDTNNWKI
jgi:hypothetical protein